MANINQTFHVTKVQRTITGIEAVIFDGSIEAIYTIPNTDYHGEATLSGVTAWIASCEPAAYDVQACLQQQYIFLQLEKLLPYSLDAILLKQMIIEYGSTRAQYGISKACNQLV